MERAVEGILPHAVSPEHGVLQKPRSIRLRLPRHVNVCLVCLVCLSTGDYQDYIEVHFPLTSSQTQQQNYNVASQTELLISIREAGYNPPENEGALGLNIQLTFQRSSPPSTYCTRN